MECPLCRKPLEQKSYRGGITVDECLWCRGVWFDPGELETYRVALPSLRADEGSQPPAFKPTSQDEKRSCPRCQHNTLVKGKINDIELEKCRDCRGVFVSGEQIAILNHNTTPSAGDSVLLGARFIDSLLFILPGL
jgi:Zn-finger nucleic acid-binding protein